VKTPNKPPISNSKITSFFLLKQPALLPGMVLIEESFKTSAPDKEQKQKKEPRLKLQG